jgi:hypothetical protein
MFSFNPSLLNPSLFNPLGLDPLWPWLLLAGLLHLLIGLVATTIAHRKGHPLGLWIWLGPIGGTPSLLLALGLGPVTPSSD